jgi:hypothetical protein
MTATISQRPTVDPQTGDILLHGRQGFSLPVNFVDEATGNPARCHRLADLFRGRWRAAGCARHRVAADERVIVLSQGQVASIFGGTFDFAVVDESGGVPDTPWTGSIEHLRLQGRARMTDRVTIAQRQVERVVLRTGSPPQMVVGASRTRVVIANKGAPGTPGAEGPPGPQGDAGQAGIPEFLDGGNF